MANYKEFPEIIATLIFLPIGIFMGHMMHYLQMSPVTEIVGRDVKYWPFVIGGIMAIITGATHLAIKLKYKQYKFEHMYFQMVGLVVLLITGILVASEKLQVAAFVGFVGHGIIYVSALSYINIRTGKSKHRYLKLSMPHFVYLIGVGIGATLVWVENDIFIFTLQPEWWWNSYFSITTGMVIVISSSILLGGFLINEVLQHTMRSYNYKESLDHDVNRENTNKEILKNKYFHITPAHLNFIENTQLPHIPLKTESSGLKECGYILYALGSKVLTLMFFYYPFTLLYSSAAILSYDANGFIIIWFGTGGLIISLIFMALINYKINYLISIAVKIVFMIALLAFFSYEFLYVDDMKILFWFVFMGLGFGFSHPDINILSYTNLMSNEIVLAIGYFIEHLIIGVIQYEALYNPENIFDASSTFNFIFAHALTFLLILFGLGMLGIFVIPNGKHNSLLEIKNILNNCADINQLVNTGNYDGQQNPQLYWQQQMYLQQNYPQIAQVGPQVPPMPYDPNNSTYRPPYSQNMFHYGEQPNYPPPQQQQQQGFQHYPQYQQTPYINTTYPSQMNNAPGPGPYNNPNLPPAYPQHQNQISIPAVAMMPQKHNFQNLPPNLAPMTDSTYAPPPSQYDQNIARPIIPPTNMK